MPTAAEVFNNPKFQALSPAEKIAVLGRIDPNFAKLSPQDQQALVARAAPTGFQEAAPQAEQYSSPHVEAAGQFLKGVGETINPVNWYQGMKAGMQSKDPNDVMLASLARGYGGPPAEAIARTMVIPTARALGSAADWYQKAARGKIPNAYEQALSVAPEALGQGTGQAILMREPIEQLARTGPVNALASAAGLSPAGPVPIRPGPLWGVATRAKAGMDAIEAQHPSVPVSPMGAYSRAIEAYEASQHGFAMPKAISDFLDAMQRQNGQLTFKQARFYEKALRETVNWEGQTDFMNGLMKKMREALVRDNAIALERAVPGTGRAYLTAKAQFERAGSAKAQGGKLMGGLGAIAGYELGAKVGHPFTGMSVLGPLARYYGRGAGEAAIGAVTDLPRPFANIPGPSRLAPLTLGSAAPVRQPSPDEEGQ